MNSAFNITILLAVVTAATSLARCSEAPGPRSNGAARPDTTATATAPPVTDGVYEERYPEGGLRIQGTMKDGRRHGLWTAYFPDGSVQSRNGYVNGVQHGPSVVFHQAGVMAYTGDYVNGVQVGEWRYYERTGTLARTVVFDSTGTLVNNR